MSCSVPLRCPGLANDGGAYFDHRLSSPCRYFRALTTLGVRDGVGHADVNYTAYCSTANIVPADILNEYVLVMVPVVIAAIVATLAIFYSRYPEPDTVLNRRAIKDPAKLAGLFLPLCWWGFSFLEIAGIRPSAIVVGALILFVVAKRHAINTARCARCAPSGRYRHLRWHVWCLWRPAQPDPTEYT